MLGGPCSQVSCRGLLRCSTDDGRTTQPNEGEPCPVLNGGAACRADGGLGMGGPGLSPPAIPSVVQHPARDDPLVAGRRNAVWGLWQEYGTTIRKKTGVR